MMIRRYFPFSGARASPFRGAVVNTMICVSVCLSFSIGPTAAFGGAIEDLEAASGGHIDRPSHERDDEAEAERRQAWAEYRAEQAAERAAAREAYNKVLNEARQKAESSREYAGMAAEQARSKGRELAQLRDAVADPGQAAAADRRVQDARKAQAALTAQLADLQKWTNSLGTRTSPGFDTAVRLSEDALYKVISPAQFVTPAMYQQARTYRDAQLKQLRDLQEQSRFLSTHSVKSDERTRLEQQVQARAIAGLGSDLLDLLAPRVAKGGKDLKIRYEQVNLAAALINTATAPDSAERAKNANESLSSYISLYNEARLDPDPKVQAVVNSMALSLKVANVMIDRNAAGRNTSGAVPAGLCDDYTECVKVALDLGGVVFPEAKFAHAVVSLNDRANQYVRAQNAMAQIAKMKGQGIAAQEYIDSQILQISRNLESTERTIKAFEQGGRK